MKREQRNGWKIATIVLSIVCFFLVVALVIESVVLIAFIAIQNEFERMEIECATQICSSEEYDSYLFDKINEICYCYIGEDIALEQKVA